MSVKTEYQKSLRKAWRLRNREFVYRVKRMAGCGCGEDHVACLEFHHLDPTTKEMEIRGGMQDWCIARLKKEMRKCLIICSNCHRKLHWEEKQCQPSA